MLYLVSHTAALLVLAAVLWLPGYVLGERWLGRRRLAALRPLARVCLGLGVWLAVLFVLAALGLLGAPAIAAVTVVLLAAALWTQHGRKPGRRWRIPPSSRAGVLAGAALTAVLTPLYLLAISPAVSWDAGVYHLALPKLWIEHGGFRTVPFNVYSNWPLNVELLFAMAMIAWDYVVAKLVHFAFGLLTLWTIHRGCRDLHPAGRACGWIAAALFLANPVVAFEFHVAYVDLAHAFFLAAGFLFLSRSLDRRADAPQALLLAGICAGVVAGLKLNGIVGAAILGSLYLPRLLAARRSGEGLAALRAFAARFVLPVIAFWAPWLLKSAWTTGNPIYPLVFGGPYWSPALGDALRAWHRGMGMGREPLDYLLLPERVILSGGEGYGRFDGALGAFWIVLLPLALWAARTQAPVRRALWVAGVYFAAWAATSQQMRLLIPVLPLLAIAAAIAVVDLGDRLASGPLRPAVRRLAVAASLALAAWYGTDASPGVSRGRYLAAAGKSLGRYLEAQGDLRPTAVHPVYRFLDEQLPAGARLLLLNTAQAFFCEREVIADSFFEASQIADWLAPATSVAALRALLAEEGITHLLFEHRDWGIAYPPALFEMLQDPSQVAVVYRSPEGRFSVVELRPAALLPNPSPPWPPSPTRSQSPGRGVGGEGIRRVEA
jgi:hypothetical protein